MPVGNDVVDLRDPGNQPDAIHSRFDTRVFNDEELRLIGELPSVAARHVLRWTLWAAKESVVKLVRQRDATVPFRPRGLSVRLTASDRAEVSHGGAVYLVDLDITDERVHATARDPDAVGTPVSGISRPGRSFNTDDASALVRAEAARSVGERLGIESGEIEIVGRIPRAIRNGKRLPVDVSLSHHGRYLAHAVLGGVLLLVVGLSGCSDPTDPGAIMEAARARWQAQALDSYGFDYQQSCFCAFTRPVRITVEAGVVTAVEPLDGGPDDLPVSAFPTIDDLFDRLAAAEANDPVVFEVEFHPVLGFPTFANIDISRQIADEEFSFEVGNVEESPDQ